MTKLLLIDLDGTARRTVSGQICPTYAKDQVLYPAFKYRCEALQHDGWTIVGITNQGGCEAINHETGKPYKSREQAEAECKYFLDLARWCDRVYMCPNGKGSDRDEVYRVSRSGWLWPKYWTVHEHNGDHPNFQTSGYRKPKSGMVELAIRDQQDIEWFEARKLGIRERDADIIEINALMVGDMESDRICAKNANIPYLDQSEFNSLDITRISRLLFERL